MNDLSSVAKNIKLLILDCDGVLTDGRVYFTVTGDEIVAFNILDGYGIIQLQNSGVTVAVISGRKNDAIEARLKQLHITHYFLGHVDKNNAFESLLKICSVSAKEVAYMGDDLPDLPLMKKVALPITVPNAMDAVKKVAKMCTIRKGGKGAVREACGFILEAKAP